MDDIKNFIINKHQELKDVWTNSDDKQQNAILTAGIYGGLIMTFLCVAAAIIF